MKINEGVTIIQLDEDNFLEIGNGLLSLEDQYELDENEVMDLIGLKIDLMELQEELVPKLEPNQVQLNMIRSACDKDSPLYKQFLEINDRQFNQEGTLLEVAN